MKKLLTFITLLFSISSCVISSSADRGWFENHTFKDECKTNDSTFYNMTCNTFSYGAEVYFFKRIVRCVDTTLFIIDSTLYIYYKDTVMTDKENYRYSVSEFKLLIKNKINEKDYNNLIKYSEKMYCSYEVINEIYNFINKQD